MFKNNEIFKTPKGYIGMCLHRGGEYDPTTGRLTKDAEILQEAEFPNLIVNKASVLMAQRLAPGKAINDNTGTYIADGLQFLAVGTGVGTGDYMNPQAAALTNTTLRTELFRKEFTSWTFVDPVSGNDTTTPTNVLKLVTTYLESEAVGALVEMGLFGGDATGAANSGHMFNYKTFPVNNQAA
ncbi:hypothetical protein D3C81_797900 [compost metagenome]